MKYLPPVHLELAYNGNRHGNVVMIFLIYTPLIYCKPLDLRLKTYLALVDFVGTFSADKDALREERIWQLRMPLSDLDLLIKHYLTKRYYCYWFDFEGKAINEISLARLRHVFRHIKEAGYFNVIVSHFTNVKREIISYPESNDSPASDILCSIAGANILGTNREPRRAPPEAAMPLAAALEHKT